MASNYNQALADLQIDPAADGPQGALLALLTALAATDSSAAVAGLDYSADVLAKAKKYLPTTGNFQREVLASLQTIVDRRTQGKR